MFVLVRGKPIVSKLVLSILNVSNKTGHSSKNAIVNYCMKVILIYNEYTFSDFSRHVSPTKVNPVQDFGSCHSNQSPQTSK